MWIARDRDNSLFLYITKRPIKIEAAGQWLAPKTDYIELDSKMYPEVKWEDNKPRKLVLG